MKSSIKDVNSYSFSIRTFWLLSYRGFAKVTSSLIRRLNFWRCMSRSRNDILPINDWNRSDWGISPSGYLGKMKTLSLLRANRLLAFSLTYSFYWMSWRVSMIISVSSSKLLRGTLVTRMAKESLSILQKSLSTIMLANISSVFINEEL